MKSLVIVITVESFVINKRHRWHINLPVRYTYIRDKRTVMQHDQVNIEVNLSTTKPVFSIVANLPRTNDFDFVN